tara:strand:+ start:2916 stop:3575 length:660 start_codon:yes stop_codon:yes gene_type:complete
MSSSKVLKALVLCRGNSLSRIREIKDDNFDLVCLVNEWGRQVFMQKEFKEILQGKKAVHYLNREPRLSWFMGLENIVSVEKYILNVLEGEFKNSTIPGMISKVKKDAKVVPLSENMYDHGLKIRPDRASFPSTGVLALVDSVVNQKATDVTVIGLDFFEDSYFSENSFTQKKEPGENQKKKGSKMKSFVSEFLSNNPEVNFTFITNSSFDPKLNHVSVK